MYTRKQTRTVQIGKLIVGGGHPVRIQSMTNTKTRDVEATVAQIHRLEALGCEIVRATVPDMESAQAFSRIKKQISIPLVADIHFDYRLAIAAVENGADKIRINPGNIGSKDRVKAVADACRNRRIPIRIGVNAGSLHKDLLAKYGGPTPQALVESAEENIRMLEECGFEDIVVSLKASNLNTCVDAYLAFAEKYPYPLHLGITEAGTLRDGSLKSAMGLGIMLHAGIGDTIRVSLTDQPEEEIKAAKKILMFAGLRTFGAEFISCPTCGRTSVDLIALAQQVQEKLEDLDLPIKIAVMGCAVNGPGEAREADLGIACGKGEGLIFKKGTILYKVPEQQLVQALVREVEELKKEISREALLNKG